MKPETSNVALVVDDIPPDAIDASAPAERRAPRAVAPVDVVAAAGGGGLLEALDDVVRAFSGGQP